MLGTRGTALLSHADSVIECLLKCVDLKNKTAAGYAAKVCLSYTQPLVPTCSDTLVVVTSDSLSLIVVTITISCKIIK